MTHGDLDTKDNLVVRCGELIDGTGAPVRRGVSLIVERGVIRDIVPSVAEDAMPADRFPAIDASGATVMPGLIDLHLHLTSVIDPDEPHPMYSMLTTSSPLLALHAAKNARIVLEAGFTTVRDLAGTINSRNAEVVALRRAIEIGLVPGPRVFAAGWVCQTGGHLDMALPTTWPAHHEERADGPWAIRRQVREMVRGGVDLLKTSERGSSTQDEWEALVDEAHTLGRRVAVHSRSVDSAKRALRAGMDTIEHGTDLDGEAIGLLVERGAYLVPTLSKRGHTLERQLEMGAADAEIRDSQAKLDAALETVSRAHAAGVKITCGTDTYRSQREYWGQNAYELEMLVRAGLSPMEVLVAATRTNAEALGQEKSLGTLEVGKAADLLVLEGNPLADIRVLQHKERIRLIVRGGQIVVDRRDLGRRYS